MNLTKYRLGDIAAVNISGVDKKSKEGEIPVRLCNFVDVYYNWAITQDKYDSFMEATCRQDEIDDFTIRKGMVAITKDSETRDDIGVACYIADDFDKTVVLGYHTAMITPDADKLDGKYLNALLHTAYFQKYWFNNASGSGQRYTLSQDSIENATVYLPSIDEQRKIGDFFSKLDRKIALNRRENATLEAMARQLYDYWFVQFDFPDANGRPYKTSGGKMVWNETLKREIPEGWEDCELGHYIGRITNGLNPRDNFTLGSGNNYYITIRSLSGTDINWDECDRCDDEALKKINSRSQLQIGDIIFSAIGTIGRTYRIYEDPSNWNISETSFTLRSSEGIPVDYFYSLLTSEYIQKSADRAAMGSTLRCLVMDSLQKILCVKVPEIIMNNYSAEVNGIYRRIYHNNQENRKLKQMLQFVMPLLMTQQVKVE